jgi:hypothetical protein
VFSFISVVGSIPVGGSQSRPRRHPLGRNYQDPAAHLFDLLAQIVNIGFPIVLEIMFEKT